MLVEGLTDGEATVLPFDHEYADGVVAVPPAVAATDKVELPPRQILDGDAVAVATIAPGTDTACEAVAVQLLPSVTVTL